MVVLRCTQTLLARLKQADNLPAVESTTRLGDWYGNILQLGRRQHLLFISERSRLPVVVPIREGRRLANVFPDAVCEVLGNVGVAAADIADERSRMSEIVFGRTRKALPPFDDLVDVARRQLDRPDAVDKKGPILCLEDERVVVAQYDLGPHAAHQQPVVRANVSLVDVDEVEVEVRQTRPVLVVRLDEANGDLVDHLVS